MLHYRLWRDSEMPKCIWVDWSCQSTLRTATLIPKLKILWLRASAKYIILLTCSWSFLSLPSYLIPHLYRGLNPSMTDMTASHSVWDSRVKNLRLKFMMSLTKPLEDSAWTSSTRDFWVNSWSQSFLETWKSPCKVTGYRIICHSSETFRMKS